MPPAEPFEPVRSRSATADAMNQILERIRSGRLHEGDTLPGERVLASQLDLSRPTVRLVVERLISAGILQNGPGRSGSPRVVSIWIPDELVQYPETTPEPDEIFKLLEARRTLEPRVAQLAALRADEAQLSLMDHSIELLRSHQNDIRRAAQAETLFHRTIWRAAGNPALERMMVGLVHDLAVVHDMILRTPADYASGIHLHVRTLEVIRRGDPLEIEEEMGRHLGHFEGIVEDVLGRKSVRASPSFLTAGVGPTRRSKR
jgi:GntR family transcriptional regulator, transcriptional repressor for pyruvate dehydrogenase complex